MSRPAGAGPVLSCCRRETVSVRLRILLLAAVLATVTFPHRTSAAETAPPAAVGSPDRSSASSGSTDTGQQAMEGRPAQPSVSPAAPADASPPPPAPGRPDTAEPSFQAERADTAMTRSVISMALEFLEPRTLEVYTPRQLVVWGLGGISALDPALTVRMDATGLILSEKGQPILIRPVPAASDGHAWADVAAGFCAAAWEHSETIRAAGHAGLRESFFGELFNHLDPYSRYISASDAKSDREERSGDVADVGLTLQDAPAASHVRRRHRGASDRKSVASPVMISAVNANGPAWPAGVDVGEYLVSVGDRSTAGHTAEEVSGWLEGDAGSQVTLRVSPEPDRRGRQIVLRRSVVPPETVFAFTTGPLVILRMTGFSASTADEMSQYLDQAMEDGHLKGLILDLRGNRGGVLQQAVTAASLLLDRGVAVVTKGRDPQANHVWAVRGGDMTSGVPVAILVDGRTASSAEILAAALSDHHRAVVIGSATLGKGLVQTVAQMPDGGELFVTWSRVLAPLGWPLQGLGVMPQVCTSLGLLETRRELDGLAGKKDGEILQAAGILRQLRYPVPVPRILDLRKNCPAAAGSDTDLEVAREILESQSLYKAAIALVPESSAVRSDYE
ncbi:PDZ domain-containing protein [Acetobacter sp. AN02]|uniref:S41 family peptidase n=1 Tax=Acetobacter sp. AN02 TaxID=2894186 RepID=UPI0024345B93|nr:S41 family peptidase [Acetobacter sp. AN02]MDG6095076.1 PDZ domain-containing protein [Acetobacter sp. AN02]